MLIELHLKESWKILVVGSWGHGLVSLLGRRCKLTIWQSDNLTIWQCKQIIWTMQPNHLTQFQHLFKELAILCVLSFSYEEQRSIYLLSWRSTRRRQQRRCAASLRRLSSFSTLNLKPATPSPRSRHVKIAAWKKIESFWSQERECHLWREHFPHLRLLGRGIPLIPPTTTTTTTDNTTATSTIGNNNSSALSVTRLRPSDPNDRLRHSGGSRQRPSAPRRGRHPPPVDVSQVSFRDFCWQLGSAWDWTNYWTLEEVLTALYRYFLLGHQPRKLASLVKLHSDNICKNMLTIVPSCSQAAKICWESSGDLCIAVDLSPLCIILRTGVRRPLRSTAATKRTARATWPTRPGVGCWATSLRRSRRNTSRRNCSTPSWSSCWSAFTKSCSFYIFRFRLVWRRRCSQQCRSTVSGLQLRWELVQSQPGWSSDFTRVNLADQTWPWISIWSRCRLARVGRSSSAGWSRWLWEPVDAPAEETPLKRIPFSGWEFWFSHRLGWALF